MLLGIKLGQLLLRHVVNEKVISYLRVSEYPLLMGLSHSLGKYSWVLSIEEQVDSGKLHVLLRVVPDS